MSKRDELNRKRAEAVKRHKAATRKISRLKANGVMLSGSKVDPRRDLSKVKKYTAKQLDTYIGQLNGFTSRKVQFAPGMKSTLLDGTLWNQYLRLQGKLNAAKAADLASRADTHIPMEGMTVGEIVNTVPDHPTTGNPATRMPHIPVNRKSTGIPNNEQLKKLIDDLKKQEQDGFIKADTDKQRVIALSMMDTIGDVDLLNDIGSLSDEKFRTLWSYTKTFANVLSFDYLIAKSRLHGDKELSWHDSAFDNQLVIMRNMIDDINGKPRRSEKESEES